jgi:hypothetical protein
MWSVCDRCGFDYKRRNLRKESTKFVVCSSCYDGIYDLKSHPQNRPFRPRRELLPVPDGRQIALILPVLVQENGAWLLTQDGNLFAVTGNQDNTSLPLFVQEDDGLLITEDDDFIGVT